MPPAHLESTWQYSNWNRTCVLHKWQLCSCPSHSFICSPQEWDNATHKAALLVSWRWKEIHIEITTTSPDLSCGSVGPPVNWIEYGRAGWGSHSVVALCSPQIQTFTASSCPFLLSEDCKYESEIISLKGCWLGCRVCNLQLTDGLWNLIWVRVLICILLPE